MSIRLSRRTQVILVHVIGRPSHLPAAMFHQDAVRAEPLDQGQAMAHEHDRATPLSESGHRIDAFALELGITYREDFVDEEYIGVEMCGHGES